MRKLSIAILGSALLATGCATSGPLSDEMTGWQGQDIGAVLAVWGPPATETTVGDQRLLVWLDREAPGLRGAPAAAGLLCERMLAIDDGGTVTGWRWRGDSCEALWRTSADQRWSNTAARAKFAD